MDAKKIKPASDAHAKAHDEIRELLSRIDHIAKTQLVGTDDSTDVLTAIAETTHGLASQLLQNAGTAKGSYTDPVVQAQFLEGVLTSIPSLVAYIDRNYIYQYVNAGYERWFGTTREFCLGRTMAEVIGQAAVDAVRSNFDAALRGETQDFERFMNYRTGGARHIRVKYIPDIDRNGSVKGVISIVSDITNLKEQEKTYRFLRETMNDGFVLQNPRGEITQFNAAALEVLALTEDELFGRTSRDPSWKATRQDNSPFPGDEHPAMVALKSGRPVSGVIMGLNLPSGVKKWIRINAQPFSGPKIDGTGLDGVPLDRWVTCTFSDLTDMVATQSKMAEFFDASLDLIVIANTDGSLKTVNSTFKNVLGYTDAEIASNGFMNFIHPDDVDATLKVVASLAEGVQVVKFENRYRTKSGEYRQISWNCQPNIETGDLYATGRDVTAFRESEASFREVFDHVPVGIIKLDSKFRFLSVNPAYANMLGYTV
jgi:PAS domain S-box-containing protein